MTKLLRLIGWQIRLLARYQILSVALVIAVAYAAVLYGFPSFQNHYVAITIIFTDPVAIGFIFVGAMLLFERGDNTLEAQVMTPMSSWQYIFAKVLALTLPALMGGIAVGLISYGWQIKWFPFLAGLILSSMLFTALGIAGAIRVKTLNQYFMVIPAFLAPSFLPCLNFFGLTRWNFLAVLPTQATLNLFGSAFALEGYNTRGGDVFYLAGWVVLSVYLAKVFFEKELYQ